jgi:tetratricopeptide (TPR) repeat protein
MIMTQTTLRDYLQTTEDAISSGRVNDALTKCQYILTRFPESLEALRLLGEVYLAQGKLEEAQHTFDWVLTNDPENVMAYCNRALISERLSDYDTALDCYQQAYELSRGNGQIRQVFNQLSEKVGQQGFIFSRAGLARLYMRGDLLPQAAQEWDTVLTTNPERLDARTGLLETYWREGAYDQVERLAKQFLHDVPHCLKALLLLAHVTFPQDALQAKDLMQQAEALDPDQVMAQELFSDLIAKQPKAPFLTLLKKTPTVFSETSNGQHNGTTSASSLENTSTASNGKTHDDSSTFSDPLVKWGSLDNIIEPQQDYQSLQNSAPYGNWSGSGASDIAAWSTFSQQDYLSSQPTNQVQAGNTTPHLDNWNVPAKSASPSEQQELEPWQSLPGSQENQDSSIDSNHSQQQPAWYHMDSFGGSSADLWSNTSNDNQLNTPALWDLEEQESDLPAPPAWLDMLTRGDHQQSSGSMPQVPPSTSAPEQEAVQQPAHQPVEAASTPIMTTSWDQLSISSSPSQPAQEEEEFFFGPEWLKSLGATTIEPLTPQQPEKAPQTTPSAVPAPSISSTPTATPAPAVDWSAPSAATDLTDLQVEEETSPGTSEAKQTISVENWLEQAAQKLSHPGQNLQTTLEELENELHAQGFTPLEPGTLTTLAKEPTLSSALAQFGNYSVQPATETDPIESTQQAAAPITPPVELLWPDISESVIQPLIVTTTSQTTGQSSAATSHLDALSSLVSSHSEAQIASITSYEPARTEEQSHPVASVPSNTQPAAASTAPTAQPGTPYDFELETTMKRPVVRLQPMQQHPSTSAQQLPARNRSGELAPSQQPENIATSNKQRLIKGYQYQLGGSYDEAMHEYRIIIRNAPELLGEVVSNMRALLKIAPKYSAGYRVLGDAYMRQGEYLQAMEAYNKALTMAKKTRI